MIYYCLDGDVEEEKGCEEFSNFCFLEGLEMEFFFVEKGCYGWFFVVFFWYWSMSV